jgi:hypothetical protein
MTNYIDTYFFKYKFMWDALRQPPFFERSIVDFI